MVPHDGPKTPRYHSAVIFLSPHKMAVVIYAKRRLAILLVGLSINSIIIEVERGYAISFCFLIILPSSIHFQLLDEIFLCFFLDPVLVVKEVELYPP